MIEAAELPGTMHSRAAVRSSTWPTSRARVGPRLVWSPACARPGATGRSYSSFDTIVDSIRSTLLPLPGDTTVRTGHRDSTSIGAKLPHLEEWITRGDRK